MTMRVLANGSGIGKPKFTQLSLEAGKLAVEVCYKQPDGLLDDIE